MEKKKLDVTLSDSHWKAASDFKMATRLKVLQWKILHNIYPTNILLQKIGIKETNRCTACNSGDIAYIEHFFFNCTKIHSIWTLAQNEIFKRTGTIIKIIITEALLGYHTTSTKAPTKNHIITLAKKCISKYRYGESFPIDIIFEQEIMLFKD